MSTDGRTARPEAADRGDPVSGPAPSDAHGTPPPAVATSAESLLLLRARRLAASPAAAPYGFEEFTRRVARRRRRRRAGRRAVALGALVLLFGAGFANWSAWQPPQPRGRVLASAPVAAATYADQSWLAALPPEPVVVSVETRMAVAELEDRIAWIDDSLSASTARGDVLLRIGQLQDERARLVDSLVRVRYAEQLVAASQ